MAAAKAHADSIRKSPIPPGIDGSGDLFGLLRYSHVFSSVIREVLEIKLLREISPTPLTLSQFHLLKLISLDGHHQVGELAHFLGVSPPAITKSVDKLEGLGLVVRGPSPDDRRVTLLSSSPGGRKLVERYERLKLERLAPVLEEFTADELETLADLLERFSFRLLEVEAGSDSLCLRCSAYYAEHCTISHLDIRCPYQFLRSDDPPAGDSA